jgi:OmpA-OmpF porin, OOP family
LDLGEGDHWKKVALVEGKVTRLDYWAPVGKNALEVFRNYQQALSVAGLKAKFACQRKRTNLVWDFKNMTVPTAKMTFPRAFFP